MKEIFPISQRGSGLVSWEIWGKKSCGEYSDNVRLRGVHTSNFRRCDSECFMDIFQHCLSFSSDKNSVRVGADAVVLVPAVSVTLDSFWMVLDAITKYSSIDIAPPKALGKNTHLRELVDLT